MPESDFPSGGATKKAVESIVADVYKELKSRFFTGLALWKAKPGSEVILKRLKSIRYVKTLLEVEREIDLGSFYYPSMVVVDGEATEIGAVSDLPGWRNIVIQGTVGQGKSMFFRYLATREIGSATSIPLFLELRRLDKADTLVSMLCRECELLGLGVDESGLKTLAATGRFTVFLDGFDEVSEERRETLIAEIENLSREVPTLRILVTARPEAGIEKSPAFRVFKLAALEYGEFAPVIRRLVRDQRVAQRIISDVEKSDVGTKALLTTPLMVTLLVVRYKVDQTIPENEGAFFGDLFDILVRRHDKLKSGFNRQRKSGLGDPALRETFDAMCYLTRRGGVVECALQDLVAFCAKALKVRGHVADPGAVVADFNEITCLVLIEGTHARFVHKSVQEYHAAVFIAGRPSAAVEMFYANALRSWRNWRQELHFLSRLDEYRYLKYCCVPLALRLFGLKSASQIATYSITESFARSCYDDDRLELEEDGGRPWVAAYSHSGGTDLRFFTAPVNAFMSALFALDPVELKRVARVSSAKSDSSSTYTVLVEDLFNSDQFGEKTLGLASQSINEIHEEAMRAIRKIDEYDRSKTLFDLEADPLLE